MRVGRETRGQAEGRCTIFDDSFEHEVWNRADSNRYNVFMQFWHPELSDEEITGIQQLEKLPQIQNVITQYLEGASALPRPRELTRPTRPRDGLAQPAQQRADRQ